MKLLGDPIAPLAAARANGFGMGLHSGPAPEGDGWLPATALAGEPLMLEAMLDRCASAAGTASRAVAATWQLEKHAWFTATASLAGLIAHGALPPLDGACLRYGPEGWADRIALPATGWRPAGPHELAGALEDHLAPLVDRLAAHRPRRALWRSAGDRLGQAALWCGDAFRDRHAAWSLAEAALGEPTALYAPGGFEIVDGAPFRRRSGCCLSHRCPGGATCADCPLRCMQSIS